MQEGVGQAFRTKWSEHGTSSVTIRSIFISTSKSKPACVPVDVWDMMQSVRVHRGFTWWVNHERHRDPGLQRGSIVFMDIKVPQDCESWELQDPAWYLLQQARQAVCYWTVYQLDSPTLNIISTKNPQSRRSLKEKPPKLLFMFQSCKSSAHLALQFVSIFIGGWFYAK